MSFTYEQRIDLNINFLIDSTLQEMYKKPILDIIDKFIDDIFDENNVSLSKIYGKYRIYVNFVDPNTKVKSQKAEK